MKKVLSVLLVLTMLLTTLLSFASCGSKVSEKKVEENPQAAIKNAVERADTGFFADNTGFSDVVDRMDKAGSLNLTFESDSLLPINEQVKKISLTTVASQKDDKAMMQLTANVKGQDLFANLYSDGETVSFQSPGLLGTETAYSFKPASLKDQLPTSPLVEFMALPEEAVTAITESTSKLYEEIVALYEKDDAESEAKINEIYQILGITVTEEALNNADGKATDYVIITFSLTNASIRAAADKLILPMLPEEAQKDYTDLFTRLDENLAVAVTAKMLLEKKAGVLDRMELSGVLTGVGNSEGGEISVEGRLTSTVGNLELKVLRGETAFQSFQVTASYKDENNLHQYSLNVSMVTEVSTVNLLKADVLLPQEDGMFVISAKVSTDGIRSKEFELSGNLQISKDTAKIEFNSFKEDGEAAPAFKLSITATADATLPTFPTDTKEVLSLTEEELTALMQAIQAGPVGQLIFGTQPE